jgi:hypothetical protein
MIVARCASCTFGKLGDFVGKRGHCIDEFINAMSWVRSEESAGGFAHRLVDYTLAKTPRFQPVSPNLRGELIRYGDRDLHGNTVAG